MSIKALLLSMPQEEQNAMPYSQLCELRLSAYAEHLSQMDVPEKLAAWDGIMRTKYGTTVKLWNKIYDSYVMALMTVRYGEHVGHWPTEFSSHDIERAGQWELGHTPVGIQYLRNRGAMLATHAAIWTLVAGAMACLGTPLDWLVSVPIIGTAMTDYLENKLADHLFRTATFAKPSVLAVALYTAAPGETGGGTEVSGGGYARVANNPQDSNWNGTHGTTSGASSGSGGVVSNAGTLTFPTPTASWGTVTHFGLFDATTGGNLLVYGALTASKTINNGDPAPTFQPAALTFTFA
jgi:hypothetical protein